MTSIGTMLVKGNICLTGTEDNSIDFFRFNDGLAVFRVRNDPLEMGVTSKFFNI